jgi:hypothetical protein
MVTHCRRKGFELTHGYRPAGRRITQRSSQVPSAEIQRLNLSELVVGEIMAGDDNVKAAHPKHEKLGGEDRLR